MIKAEVAVYPLKTNNATSVINASIHTLDDTNVNYQVDSMNTKVSGSKTEVFRCLESMFSEAEKSGGEINMVVTVSNAGKQ